MARESLNLDTGQIEKEPPFVKVYMNDLCRLKSVSGLGRAIYDFMLSNMNDHNEVVYGMRAKKRFIESKNTSNAVFNNTVKRLIDADLVERLSKGEFRINKKFAVKVEWSKVQSIEWTTKYTKEGKVETVKIDNKTIPY